MPRRTRRHLHQDDAEGSEVPLSNRDRSRRSAGTLEHAYRVATRATKNVKVGVGGGGDIGEIPRRTGAPRPDDTVGSQSGDTVKAGLVKMEGSSELSASDSGRIVMGGAAAKRSPSDSGGGSMIDLEIESGFRPDRPGSQRLDIAKNRPVKGSTSKQEIPKSVGPDGKPLTRITPQKLNTVQPEKSTPKIPMWLAALLLIILAGLFGFLLARMTGG